ncbi:MAG TPA: radical SAM protein [Thermoanaerobaculia bacterium]|nr:radical SAM protein [Thermoanaerobaculia bacterium]
MPHPTSNRPLTVILDTTERCNLKCRMCHFSATDRITFPPFDRVLDKNGMMPVEAFDRIAAELFPRAWRVALACAAEPMVHPKFSEIVRIAGRYGVPDVWFPTNLLALTEAKAEAICDAGVNVVGVSMDGTTTATYEHIRVGGKFERLERSLTLLNDVRRRKKARTKLRIIFTWMRSNRDELRTLPEFATRWGATELDVRFVTPTPGVDNSGELLEGEDPAVLRAALRDTAHEAARRGLRLSSFPDYEGAEDLPSGAWGRLRRAWFRRRTGLDRREYDTYRRAERTKGCVWPSDFYVIRPNGAVSPCIFWDREPLGFFPEIGYDDLAGGEPLRRIREGLVDGHPVGTCATCSQRKDAFYYRLRGRRGRAASAPAEESPVVQLGRP